MKNKSIVIPILNNEYKVIVVWGTEKFLKKVAKDWNYGDLIVDKDDTRGKTYYKSDCQPIIYLPRRPKTATELGTLAHEAAHAVSNIYKYIKEYETDTEIFAHSIGAVVRETLL